MKTGRVQPYISATERLLQLPDVFTGSDIAVLFGWKSTICSSYLLNWKKAGLIKSLGGRSDVHMNLVKNRQVNPELALKRAFPHAVKLGCDVLRETGWTTQIPSSIEIAVPVTNTLYDIKGFSLSTRTDKWFQRVYGTEQGFNSGVSRSQDGVDRLNPAWALDEMISRVLDRRVKNAWLLDPEDIVLESVRSDKSCDKPLLAFDMDPDNLSDEGYENIYTEFNGVKQRRRKQEI